MYQYAFTIALRAAVRTLFQGAAGAFTAVTVTILSVEDLRVQSLVIGAGLLHAGLTAVAAFCQNFSEALKDERDREREAPDELPFEPYDYL